MLSKNQIKNISALHHKKFRREENLFIAEGEKVVKDLLNSGFKVKALYGTQEFFQRLSNGVIISKEVEMILITDDELRKISALSNPQHVLAVTEIPGEERKIDFENGLKLVLDDINDPGNLGTLIRIAAWFGIDEIICSHHSVDCFNPKVVQSAMGALFQTHLYYRDLIEIFNMNKSQRKLPVYGTVLDGKNIYKEKLSKDAFILVGNESSGINQDLLAFISDKITIPSFGGKKIDSLNVAIATGIVCAEFRRDN
jgi:RNA methyltransferase, TrmH family